MTARDRSTLWRSQNFLRRSDLVERLLDRSGIGPADVVYDLGAGTGALTEGLAARCRRVVAVEADPRLCALLRRRFADRPNVEVRCADVLDLPLPRRPYKVFANPPFDATAAIVTRLVGAPAPPLDTFLAVQWEAAERFLGVPTETLYALLLKPWFAPSVEHRFSRRDFEPAPGVDVVLLRLRKRGPPLVAAADARLYRDFVTACFTAWRPTLGDALARVVGPRLARAALRRAGVDPAPRPSATPFAAWLRLFSAFAALADGTARRAVDGAELGLRRQQARLRKRHRTATPKRPPRPRPTRAVRPGETSETRGPPASRRRWVGLPWADTGGQPEGEESMTTLANRPNTALLVVDVQNGVVAGAHARDAVVANVGRLVEKARRERVPVVWVQHSDEQLARGSDAWRIVPELRPAEAEPLVEKSYGDSFEGTALEAVLSGLGVGRLVVVGAQTDAPRRVRPRVRRAPGQRRPHDRGPDGLGGAAAGPGHRAHEPVLDLPDRAGTNRRDGPDHGRRLQRRVLKPVRSGGTPQDGIRVRTG